MVNYRDWDKPDPDDDADEYIEDFDTFVDALDVTVAKAGSTDERHDADEIELYLNTDGEDMAQVALETSIPVEGEDDEYEWVIADLPFDIEQTQALLEDRTGRVTVQWRFSYEIEADIEGRAATVDFAEEADHADDANRLGDVDSDYYTSRTSESTVVEQWSYLNGAAFRAGFNMTESDSAFQLPIYTDDDDTEFLDTDYALSGFSPRNVTVGPSETITVEVTIHNTGDDDRAQLVEYQIDGETVDQRLVLLSPGSSQTYEFSGPAPNLVGSYQHTIEMPTDATSGEVTVEE